MSGHALLKSFILRLLERTHFRMLEREPMHVERVLSKKLIHENLRVYQVSIRFLALSEDVVTRFPKGHSNLSDQLRRAALSIHSISPKERAEKTRRTAAIISQLPEDPHWNAVPY